MALKYIKSQRGCDLLIHESFTYLKNKTCNSITYWKCTYYSKSGCTGRINITNGKIVKATRHNHTPDPAEVEAREIVDKLREQALTSYEAADLLVASAIANASEAAAVQIPSIPSLKRIIERKRQTFPDFEDRLSSCEGSKGDGASRSYLSCASSIPSIVEDSGEPGLLKNAMGCGDDRSYYSEDDIIGVKSELSFPPDIEIDEENVVENTRSSSPVSRTASPTSSGMTGPYLLKKETHCSSILDELLKDDTFTDVTLSAEGQHIRAHRIILCLSSKYFKEVLSKESSAKNVIFFRDIKYDELKNLITFIYTGEVTVDAADLESFMKTAELLEVTSLCEGHKNFPKGFPLSKNSTGVSKPTTSFSKRTNSSLATHSPPSKTRKITSTTETPAQCKPRRKRSNAFSTPSTPVTVKSEPVTADSEDEDDLKEETVETSSTFIDVGHLSSEDEIGLASAARLAQGLTPEKLESTADATQVTNVTVTPGRCPFCSPTRQLYIGPIMLTHLQISHPDETAYPCDNCYSVFINKISFLAHHKECKR